MDGFIWTIASIAVIALVIFIVYKIIRYKISNAAHRYLGMSGSAAAKMIADGLRDEVNVPKPVSNLSAVYAPAIKRDFPETSPDSLLRMGQNALVASLNAIEAKNADNIADASPRLKEQVRGIIEDNASRGADVRYDGVIINKAAIADYKKTGDTARVTCEISLGCTYVEKGKSSPLQAAYRVYVAFNQKAFEETTDIAYSAACPNCGAPLKIIGGKRVCEYCGSGVKEISDRLWQADGFQKIK